MAELSDADLAEGIRKMQAAGIPEDRIARVVRMHRGVPEPGMMNADEARVTARDVALSSTLGATIGSVQTGRALLGAVKAVPETVVGLGQLFHKGAEVVGLAKPTEAFDAARAEIGPARSPEELAGKIGGNLGLAALAGEAQAPARLAQLVQASRVARMGVGAANNAAVTAAQTGGDPRATAASAVLGGALPAVIPAARAIAEAPVVAETVKRLGGKGAARIADMVAENTVGKIPVVGRTAANAVKRAIGNRIMQAESAAAAATPEGQAAIETLAAQATPKTAAVSPETAAAMEAANARGALPASRLRAVPASEPMPAVAPAAPTAGGKVWANIGEEMQNRAFANRVAQWKANGWSEGQMLDAIKSVYGSNAVKPAMAKSLLKFALAQAGGSN